MEQILLFIAWFCHVGVIVILMDRILMLKLYVAAWSILCCIPFLIIWWIESPSRGYFDFWFDKLTKEQ